MSIRLPQNPGIGGLNELTSEEELFVQNLSGLTYSTGDILYYDGTKLTNLARGTDGQVLSLSSGIPSWATTSGTGDMLAATYDPNSIAGDAFLMTNMNGGNWKVFYTDGSGNVTELALGANGTVLTSNGASSAPSFESGGLGDMTKAVYDTDDNGVVDNSEELEGHDSAYHLNRANHTGTQTASTISDFDTEVSNNTDVTANTAKLTCNTANVTAAGALMDSELASITDVKALDQSVISGASPTFGTANMTDATDKRFMTDAQETNLDNQSGTNTGDEIVATSAEVYTGTDNTKMVTPKGNKEGTIHTFMVQLLADDTDQTVDTSIGGDFRIPGNRAITVKNVGAYCDTAGTTGTFTVDINEAGTSILSTKITVDSGEKSSTTAATAPVISDSAIAADAIITFDIDAIQTTAAKGLKVWIEYVYA